MVMTSYQDLDLKYMVQLTHILGISFGVMLEYQIEQQYQSTSSTYD